MLAIAFGILASLCFAAASLLAQRGLHLTPTPWGAWLTLVANTIFLLTVHFFVYSQAPIFVADNMVFVAVGLFVPGLTRVFTFCGFGYLHRQLVSLHVSAAKHGASFHRRPADQ